MTSSFLRKLQKEALYRQEKAFADSMRRQAEELDKLEQEADDKDGKSSK
jgi:hypothetical protein